MAGNPPPFTAGRFQDFVFFVLLVLERVVCLALLLVFPDRLLLVDVFEPAEDLRLDDLPVA